MLMACALVDLGCVRNAGTDKGTTISELPSTAEIIAMGMAIIAETESLSR